MAPLSGILVAMVTPLDDDQEISFKRTDRLLDRLLTEEIAGIFILGTNGEAYVLAENEKLAFAEHVIDYVHGRTKVLVGTGLNGTAETIRFSQKIASLKPDAITLVAPSFVAPSQQELVDHFAAIIHAVDIPVLLYNMPAKTGINIEPASLKQLSKYKNLIGIKDSSGKWENFDGYLANRPERPFSVIMGSDGRILESFQHGGNAAIASTANLLTANNVALYHAFVNDNIEKAQKFQDRIQALRSVLHKATIPVSLKTALNIAGITVGPARLPAKMPREQDALYREIGDVIKEYELQGII